MRGEARPRCRQASLFLNRTNGVKDMNQQSIDIQNLKVARVNVRKHGKRDGIEELAASIKAHGLLQPLLVRPNCEGYEIVAGQRRYLAALELQKAGDGPAALPCIIMDSDDDSAAIEASLAENTARLPMDQFDQHDAFAKLAKTGKSVEDIAAAFGTTEANVRKRLALSNLLPRVKTLYRAEDLDGETLRLLTRATKAQQKDWLCLVDDPNSYALIGWRLRRADSNSLLLR